MTDRTASSTSILATVSTIENLPPLSQLAMRLSVAIMIWEMRARTRRALHAMTREELADIGVSDQAASVEAGKRFWQA